MAKRRNGRNGHEDSWLTPRQLDVLTIIRDARDRQGYSPTMQEIGNWLGISKVTVFEHVGALVKKRLLRRLPHKARSLQVTDLAMFPRMSATGVDRAALCIGACAGRAAAELKRGVVPRGE